MGTGQSCRFAQVWAAQQRRLTIAVSIRVHPCHPWLKKFGD
jgi:hypothetical protein